MCHIPAVDSEESAGAPETEIEVTPAMIEAGALALIEHVMGDEDWDAAVREIYVEMTKRAPH